MRNNRVGVSYSEMPDTHAHPYCVRFESSKKHFLVSSEIQKNFSFRQPAEKPILKLKCLRIHGISWLVANDNGANVVLDRTFCDNNSHLN